MQANSKVLFASGAIALLCGILGGTIAFMAVERHSGVVLRVHELQLVDKQNRVRASLAMNGQGGPSLSFSDRAGKVDATFGSGEWGPVLHLSGPDAWSSAYLGFGDGKPFLGFSGDHREGRVIIGYSADDDIAPSEMGHWGLTLKGSKKKRIALGIAMMRGTEYGTFAELPAKESVNFPVARPESPRPAK